MSMDAMMSAIPVGSTLSITKTSEDSKEHILFTLQIAVKQIQHYFSLKNDESALSSDIHEVKQLCESLDKAFFHGLKSFDSGYWSFVMEFTHKNTVKFLEKLDNVHTQLHCGRAWLCSALNEASLESYFRSFMQNSKVVRKHYDSLALFCDEQVHKRSPFFKAKSENERMEKHQQRMQLVLMLMAGLEYVPININVSKIIFGNGLSFFENESIKNSLIYRQSENSPKKLPKTVLPENTYELIPFDNAMEVTSDFKASADVSPSESERSISNSLHQSKSDENCQISKTVTQQDLELISHYINIATDSDVKVNSDLEVIRTKVVRRIKKPYNQNQSQNVKSNIDKSTVSATETDTSLENRLSKATTDSGLCLETPYSSDSELTDTTDDIGNSSEGQPTTFEVGDFCHDINVTFSTPIKNEAKQFLNSKNVDSDIEERGTPEGQEDPVKNPYVSDTVFERLPLQHGNDGAEEKIDSEEEELSIYDMCKISPIIEKYDTVLKETPSRPTDLSYDIKSVNSMSSTKSFTIDIVSEELAKLSHEKQEALDLRVGNNIQLYFLVEVYEHEEEIFYKLYCGYTNFSEGSSQRIYFLLSNKSIYFLKPGNSQQKFFKLGGLRYSSIDYITVDLNYQGFRLISRDRENYSLHTANEELTREILSNLEIGIRKFIPKLPLPAVFTDATAQMITIKKFLASVFSSEKDKVSLSHYTFARWEDYTSSSVTPSGPIYQDYLMYRHVFAKENKATPWKPGYFLIKGGVLYCMENENGKPLFFIQMCAPHCNGCRRIHLGRPHTFEILRSNSDSLQLAAADTYEASRWLQCFLETVSLAGHFIDAEKNVQTPCCIMIANNKIVVALEEPRKCTYRLLSKASVRDLVSVLVDPIASNFVMLEFEIAEACKSSGEWIISFESVIEKEKFLDVIGQRWSEIFQVKLNIETFKDIYLLKKYRQISEELKAEKLNLQQFCIDD